jgi:hypothetical protein
MESNYRPEIIVAIASEAVSAAFLAVLFVLSRTAAGPSDVSIVALVRRLSALSGGLGRAR